VEVVEVGDADKVDGESMRVDGKSDTLMTGESFDVMGGGGISAASSLRFLPLGAGSRGGDRL
jgi:hypothetical protein